MVSEAFDENTRLAARNVTKSLLMTADELNVEHLLRYKKIVVTNAGLEILAKRSAA